MNADVNAAAKGEMVSLVSGQMERPCISGSLSAPTVLLPTYSLLVRISLPYSLPPMDVLRIVSFSRLLNV